MIYIADLLILEAKFRNFLRFSLQYCTINVFKISSTISENQRSRMRRSWMMYFPV